MKWYKDLFLGETIAPDAKKIIKRIKNKKLTPDVYVIAFASNPQNLLDIIPSWELLQKGYPKEQVHIIGLAMGKPEAMELVRKIVDITYQTTGNVNVKLYLKSKRRDEAWA